MPITLTAVLPLRIAAQAQTSDLERVARLVLPSLERFWTDPDALELLIIVPPGDVERVRSRLRGIGRIAVRVVSEDDICPTLSGDFGWHKQQMLKLAAARTVSSRCYLTLDADVILTRPAGGRDLFPDGRAVLNRKVARRHWNWWRASQAILRTSVTVRRDDQMMDVTPAILYRDVARSLLTAIASRHGVDDPDRFLFDRRRDKWIGFWRKDWTWTEYSLYWLFVLEQGLAEELYCESAAPLYEVMWHRDHVGALAEKLGPDRARASASPLFLVVQSTLGIAPEELERLAAPLFTRG
jgi:hypothetical protein